ncbi:MAG TPA: penicillin-binding protein 2, partial [Candidatus Dormibacteraeota bacterium]|nr:penicillin-binding protein 2 [Candidatus Dormibacteraeota bacterium]
QLVSNTASRAVAVVPVDLPRGQARADELARLQKITGVAPAEVERQVLARAVDVFDPILIKDHLDDATYQVLTEDVPSMPGVVLQDSPGRHYQTGSGLAHLLGFVGRLYPEDYAALKDQGYLLNDMLGKAGLEATDEKYLRGQPGVSVVETDAQGHLVRTVSSSDPVPGNNVYLTIDLNLQREVATDLQAEMDIQHKAFGGKRALAGAAIVMNPQTGEVLSMVSLPDYDANLFADGITLPQYQALANDPRLPLMNHAISGQYPPGSTFKPVTASAALQTNLINQNTQIFCPGFLTRGGSTFQCWNHAGHGNQNVIQAITHSCDVFFYTVADNLGDKVLNKYAQDFGVGHKTGIDLPGEQPGIAPDRDWKKAYFASALDATQDPAWKDSYWYEGNTITYGIGQSYLLATPLQDLMWTATVANGGSFVRPTLTGPVTSVGGALVKPLQTVVDHKVAVSPETLAIVREGLRSAVNGPGGTAYMLKNLPTASGKTGSAQYGTPDDKGNLPIHAWFTAYAPMVDPEVAAVVFIEGGGEGSSASMPVASKILNYYFAHRDAIRQMGPTPTP